MTDEVKIRDQLQKPYFASDKDLPSWDFCREVAEPGTNEEFPDGAVGLYVDDDFWLVAVLPYSYKSWACEELVKNIWPLEFRAQCYADSGTLEQAVERYEALNHDYNRLNRTLTQRVYKLERQLRQSVLAPRESLKSEGPPSDS